MKILATLLLLLTSLTALADWQADYSALLGKYVKPTGVDYDAWHANAADRAALAKVAEEIGASTQPTGKDDAALVYYLNVYNAHILNRIVSRSKVKGVGGNALSRGLFFKKEDLPVGGVEMSFNTIEHEIIRKRFAEPRVHFALNCASASCPPLMARAFVPETLEADLAALASGYVNDNPLGVKVSGTSVQLSEIFNWFAEDFAAEGGVLAFIKKYRKTPLPAGAEISYQEYDWSLNASK